MPEKPATPTSWLADHWGGLVNWLRGLLSRAHTNTAVVALAARDAVYLDVAIVLALLSFLGTVAFAAYLERSR